MLKRDYFNVEKKTTKILKVNWPSQRNPKSVLYVERAHLLRIYLHIGVRAGGQGLQRSPQILSNSDFLGNKRNLGKASF